MDFTILIDIPSLMIVVAQGVTLGVILGLKNPQGVVSPLRALALPLGLNGGLIGFTKMLANLDDMTVIGPAFAVALLTPFYGLFTYLICTALDQPNEASNEARIPTKGTTRIAAAAVFLLAFNGAGILFGGVKYAANFIYIPAFFFCCRSGNWAWFLGVWKG